MYKKIIALVLIFVLTLSAFAGCSQNNAQVNVNNQKSKQQFVVSLNPILALDTGTNFIAFNDVKNAISADKNSATLTALSDNTPWNWVYKQGEDWKKRGIYGLEKWHNGGKYSSDTLSSYAFSSDGSIALMPYSTTATKLQTFGDEKPLNVGILLSASGKEEEAFCCQFTESGSLTIPSGNILAIKSVGGVNATFLSNKDKSATAVVKFIINSRVVWQGQFMNSVAGDGQAVTELEYPEIEDISVEEGDIFFISIALNGEYDEDLVIDDDEYESDDNDDYSEVPSEPKDTNEIEQISLIDGYDSRFKIIHSKDATITQKQIFTRLKNSMVDVFEADVLMNNDSKDESEYELLIGRTTRKESVKAYEELTSYRVNNGCDFIIRMDGRKLVIAANTDYSLQLAVNYFMSNFCKSDKDSVSSNLNYISRPNLEQILIGDTNIASFTIRTEKYPSLLTVKAAQKFSEYVIQKTGYNLKIEKDTIKTDNEILIGLTTRSGISENTFKSESLDFIKGKKGNTYNNEDYNIFVEGTKLFVEAGSDYATSHAVLKLIEQFDKNTVYANDKILSGSYKIGEYTLIDDYAYTWGDEFFTTSGSTISKKNWKIMDKGYIEDEGPWYKIDDPYYLASKASLEDNDPNNNFGGPWLPTSDPQYVQEGLSRNIDSNAVIRNNMLVQTSKKESYGYSGNVICTDGRMEYRYGILESRVMASTANGASACFWTRTKDGGSVVNEMDIYENFGTDSLRPNLHTWAETHTNHGQMITLRETCEPATGETFSDTFHHLALEWTPEFINMYLDGEIYLSQEITSDTWYAFKETTYVIFNNTAPSATYASGGKPGNYLAGGTLDPMENAKLFDTNNDGKVNIEDFYEEQLVDYIRLYQINSRQYSLKAKK